MEEDVWDTYIKTVQRGLNSIVHKILGVTPSETLFGSKPRTTSEAILLIELQGKLKRTDISEIRKEIKKRIGIDQEKQHRFNLKRARVKHYNIGDLVMMAKTDIPATGQSKQFLPKFKGPYKTSAILPNDRYVIISISGMHRKCPVVVCLTK